MNSTITPDTIRTNYEKVLHKIDKACKHSRRDPSKITLVGVTKKIETERVFPAIDAGLSYIGEVMGTEFKHKYPEINSYAPNLNIHVIGNMQRNKVKLALDTSCLIQSVKSLKILKEINKRAKKREIVYPIYLQVDFSTVDNRKGLTREKGLKLLELTKTQFTNVQVQGLMTIAPLEFEKEIPTLRKFFKKTHEIFKSDFIPVLDFDKPELSMGMSIDYEIAIEEGATMVRVGTAIFGARVY